MKLRKQFLFMGIFMWGAFCSGCTVRAVGDPKRPITIEAHITVDINGLQDTAHGIEDYVSGKSGLETSKGGDK